MTVCTVDFVFKWVLFLSVAFNAGLISVAEHQRDMSLTLSLPVQSNHVNWVRKKAPHAPLPPPAPPPKPNEALPLCVNGEEADVGTDKGF